MVNGLLTDATDTCYAHTLNLLEVYYHFLRQHGEHTARQAWRDLLAMGVVERRSLSHRFVRRVGQLKAQGRISLADCFCLVLAQEIGGQVVTSDHHESDPLVSQGIAPILFIR